MNEAIAEYLEEFFMFNIKVYPSTNVHQAPTYYIINDSEKLFFSFAYKWEEELSYDDNLRCIKLEFEKNLLNIFKNLKYRS